MLFIYVGFVALARASDVWFQQCPETMKGLGQSAFKSTRPAPLNLSEGSSWGAGGASAAADELASLLFLPGP